MDNNSLQEFNPMPKKIFSTHQGENMWLIQYLSDISDDQLAEMLNVTEEIIQDWQTLSNLPVDKIEIIAKTLKVDVSYLEKQKKLPDGMNVQTGNNNNNYLYVENRSVSSIYNPLEPIHEFIAKMFIHLKEGYEKIIETLKEQINSLIKDKEQLTEELNEEKKENRKLREQLLDLFRKKQGQ